MSERLESLCSAAKKRNLTLLLCAHALNVSSDHFTYTEDGDHLYVGEIMVSLVAQSFMDIKPKRFNLYLRTDGTLSFCNKPEIIYFCKQFGLTTNPSKNLGQGIFGRRKKGQL